MISHFGYTNNSIADNKHKYKHERIMFKKKDF